MPRVFPEPRRDHHRLKQFIIALSNVQRYTADKYRTTDENILQTRFIFAFLAAFFLHLCFFLPKTESANTQYDIIKELAYKTRSLSRFFCRWLEQKSFKLHAGLGANLKIKYLRRKCPFFIRILSKNYTWQFSPFVLLRNYAPIIKSNF